MAEITQESTSRFVKTKDWNIHYNEAGEGTPIVLLHGSGPGATGWSNFGPNMLDLAQEFRVLAVDMPGWGQSDAVDAAHRDHAEAAIQFLDALGIEKAAFVGNSMGGVTTLRTAALHPERVSHIVTMGAGSSGPTLLSPRGLSEGMKALRRAYEDPSPASMRDLVDVMTFDPAFATDELIEQRSQAARNRPDHLKNYNDGISHAGPPFAETWAALQKSELPALIIHGRDDRVVHFEHGLRISQLIPNSRLVLLNRCGHWAQLEHASEFNRLVRDFVLNN